MSLPIFFSPMAFALYLCQLSHFAIMAICLSFFALWLKFIGFEIAELTNIVSLEALMRPIGFVLALLFSRRGERATWLTAIFMTCLCVVIIPFFLSKPSYGVILVLVVLLFIPFWLISPYVETAAMRIASDTGLEVGRVVAFGTAMFGMALLLGGWFFEKYSLYYFPWVLLFLFALQVVAVFFYRRQRILYLKINTVETGNFFVAGQQQPAMAKNYKDGRYGANLVAAKTVEKFSIKKTDIKTFKKKFSAKLIKKRRAENNYLIFC